MFVLSLCLWPKKSFFCVFCLFFGHSHFLFSFLNICFPWFLFLVVLFECISFLKILFDLIILLLSLLYLLLLHTFLSFQKKKTFFWIVSVVAVSFLFERERFSVFLLQFNIFSFLNVCFASFFTPFVQPFSTCSLFLSLRVFSLFSPFHFLFCLLLDCLFVFSIYNLSSQFFEFL